MARFIDSILIVAIILHCDAAYSQPPEFRGTTSGGTNDFGTIFKTDGNGENLTTEHVFGKNPGTDPNHSLFEASTGKMYGVTYNGGEYSTGVMFEYDPLTNTTTKKIDFDDFTTGTIASEVVEAPNGKIYGLTTSGNAGTDVRDGAIYEFDPVADSFAVVKKFVRSVTGGNSLNGMCLTSNGKLYER